MVVSGNRGEHACAVGEDVGSRAQAVDVRAAVAHLGIALAHAVGEDTIVVDAVLVVVQVVMLMMVVVMLVARIWVVGRPHVTVMQGRVVDGLVCCNSQRLLLLAAGTARCGGPTWSLC